MVARTPTIAWLGIPLFLYAFIAYYWKHRRELRTDHSLPLGPSFYTMSDFWTVDALLGAIGTQQSKRTRRLHLGGTALLSDYLPTYRSNPDAYSGESDDNESVRVPAIGEESLRPLGFNTGAGHMNTRLVNAWVTAKRVFWYVSIPFVRYSSILAIIGLYFSGLTSINLINAGYVVFFCFAVIVRHRVLQRSWIVLIIYAELAIITIYVWQVTWTRPYDRNSFPRLLGLTHYSDQDNLLWDEKTQTGLIWHLVILAFSLFQHNMVKVARRREKRDPFNRKIPQWMNKTFAVTSFVFYRYGILVCYVALLLVPTYSTRSLINFMCALVSSPTYSYALLDISSCYSLHSSSTWW